MEALIHNFFNLKIYADVTPLLMKGLAMTVLLSVIVVPIGLFLGLVLAVGYVNVRNRLVKAVLIILIDVFRALPPLVLLILIYFGVPFLDMEIPKLLAVVVCFGLNNSCYFGEVFRSGLASVPRGHAEAARSTGLTFLQTLIHVQIPQATRNVAPDLISNAIETIKLTTIASAVGFADMLYMAQNAQSFLYNPSPIVLAAILYAVILVPIVRMISRMERKKLVARH